MAKFRKSKGVFTQDYYSIDPKSLGQLANLKTKIETARSKDVILNTKFLRPYCVAYLDQTLCHINTIKKTSIYSEAPGANQYLQQCYFPFLSQSAGFCSPFPQEDIIQLRRFTDRLLIDTEIKDWFESIVKRFVPNSSARLRKEIVQSLSEIVNNSFIHGDSKFGLSCCGQYYPQKKYFEIAFYDSGYGLANRVIEFNPYPGKALLDSECIEWAMQRGNSTLRDPEAGLGLYLLRQFVRITRGAFQIIAGNGFFGDMDEETDKKLTISNSIDGTLVNIRINIFDNVSYKLKGE